MGFAGGRTWSQMIKSELVELKIRVMAIEKQLSEAGLGTTTAGGKTVTIPEVDKNKPLSETTKDLVEATYTIRTTAVAMRGYLQLLGEANLPKDQKKMIRDLQYAAMAVMKTAQAIKLLILAYQSLTAAQMGPAGFLYLFLAGGVTASSITYGSKLTGGTV